MKRPVVVFNAEGSDRLQSLAVSNGVGFICGLSYDQEQYPSGQHVDSRGTSFHLGTFMKGRI